MDSAQTIRDAVERVSALRQACAERVELQAAVVAVKRYQARRFAHTYADLLTAGPYQGASRFFLDELYSDKDFAQRDAQFSRIANALQTVFPKQVVATAVALAKLHALTEELDHAMGIAWLTADVSANGTQSGPLIRVKLNETRRYVMSWRAVGNHADRDLQLSTVLMVGQELDRLTKAKGLRLLLKMMRRPAQAAGLTELQGFLEAGFDTFAQMSDRGQGARSFLEAIQSRESALIESLFSADIVTLETSLNLPQQNLL